MNTPEIPGCRHLSADEIVRLEAQDCRAASWAAVHVAPDFTPERIRRTRFHGRCFLGAPAPDGGIEDACLENCALGAGVRVARSRLRNCRVGERAVIEDVGEISQDGPAAGGDGVTAAVLRECGGREVTLHTGLSAPLAWLETLAVTDAGAQALHRLGQAAAVRRDWTEIGARAVLRRCGRITDCQIGEKASAEGAALLEHTTLNGRVGSGTILHRCVIAAGGEVGEQCLAENCFIGDGAVIGHGFKAENSLFFAGSDCHRGEACSVFAGPFTVSHHQSTLLLAGVYSFFNAGSGTNFSNHRYKLGPRHSGIMERGCKCGSGSYLMWPAHIGAFTTVLGRHPRTLDTAAFPFSQLRESQGRTVLLPGANLFSVGLMRDGIKWPLRAHLRAPGADALHCGIAGPAMATAFDLALELLDAMLPQTTAGGDAVWQGACVPAAWMERATARYRAARDISIGKTLALFPPDRPPEPPAPESAPADGDWLDMAGTWLPRTAVAAFLERVTAGEFADYAAARAALAAAGGLQDECAKTWIRARLAEDRDGFHVALGRALRAWEAAERLRAEERRRDLEKEFAPEMLAGTGMYAAALAEFTEINGDDRENALRTIAETEAAGAARARELAAAWDA